MARLRGGPSGKVVVIRASAVGAMTAAPTPCKARAASSQACVVAKPPNSEASENRTIPAMKTRLDAGVVIGVSPVVCVFGGHCGCAGSAGTAGAGGGGGWGRGGGGAGAPAGGG